MSQSGGIHGLGTGRVVVPSGIYYPGHKQVKYQSPHIKDAPVPAALKQFFYAHAAQQHVQFVEDPQKQHQQVAEGITEKGAEHLSADIILFKITVNGKYLPALILFKYGQPSHISDLFFVQHTGTS